jgi:hypothetical protein
LSPKFNEYRTLPITLIVRTESPWSGAELRKGVREEQESDLQGRLFSSTRRGVVMDSNLVSLDKKRKNSDVTPEDRSTWLYLKSRLWVYAVLVLFALYLCEIQPWLVRHF